MSCTCSSVGRAHRWRRRRRPCSCSSLGRARKWRRPRMSCTCSSLGRARRWRRRRISCSCSCVCCARRWRRRRRPRTHVCVGRAGISSSSLPPATSVLLAMPTRVPLLAAAGHCSLLLRKCKSDCEAPCSRLAAPQFSSGAWRRPVRLARPGGTWTRSSILPHMY